MIPLPEPWQFAAAGAALGVAAALFVWFIPSIRIALILGGCSLGLFACAAVAHEYEARGAKNVQAKWDADRAMLVKRAADLTTTLYGLLDKAHAEAAVRQGEMDGRFRVVEAKLAAVPVGRSFGVSAASAGVFDAATNAANAARPDAAGQARTDPIPTTPEAEVRYDEREFAGWVVSAGAAYADAYGLWKACRDREDGYLTVFAKGVAP